MDWGTGGGGGGRAGQGRAGSLAASPCQILIAVSTGRAYEGAASRAGNVARVRWLCVRGGTSFGRWLDLVKLLGLPVIEALVCSAKAGWRLAGGLGQGMGVHWPHLGSR